MDIIIIIILFFIIVIINLNHFPLLGQQDQDMDYLL